MPTGLPSHFIDFVHEQPPGLRPTATRRSGIGCGFHRRLAEGIGGDEDAASGAARLRIGIAGFVILERVHSLSSPAGVWGDEPCVTLRLGSIP